MLKGTTLNKKNNTHNETFFQEGMNLIRGSLYKQATKAFIQALQDDTKTVSGLLTKKFNSYLKSSQYEAAIAIGEALRGMLSQKTAFLVSIGNCYRHLLDFQKANDLYREALRVDKSNRLAIFNLAASLAKVDKYDLEIKKTLEQFKWIEQYILPPYLNDPNIVEKITEDLNKEREQRIALVESLQREKSIKQEVEETEAVKKIVKKIEIEERHLALSDYQAICKKLRKAIKTNWAKQTIEESKANLQENLFNLGLYALSQNDLELASESFEKLELENNKIENLDLLLAITYERKGYKNKAINKLVEVLKQNPNNRYVVVNLGLMYRRRGNTLLSMRYLLKAAELLEESSGLFNLADIETRANEYFEDDNFSEAFALYKIIAKESPNPHVLIRIGEIHIRKEECVEATMALHEALEFDPNNTKAEQKLLQIHDIYVLKGDTHFRNGFDREAISLYQNALEIHKSVEVINKTIKAYEKLGDFNQVNSLKSEIRHLKAAKKAENLEKERLALVEQGKLLMKQKKFDKAIEHLESAFKIKPDKDTFLMLAYILKSLKHSRKLSSLMKQWRQVTEQKD